MSILLPWTNPVADPGFLEGGGSGKVGSGSFITAKCVLKSMHKFALIMWLIIMRFHVGLIMQYKLLYYEIIVLYFVIDFYITKQFVLQQFE